MTCTLILSSTIGLSENRRFTSDLPTCLGSPFTSSGLWNNWSKMIDVKRQWNNCYGVINFFHYITLEPHYQEGEFIDRQVVKGWKCHPKFSCGQFFDNSKNLAVKITDTANTLRKGFDTLSKDQRIQIQSNLKDSGSYKSSIDGLYGSSTKKALDAYNKQHLGGSDLTKAENVQNLLLILIDATPPPETFNPNQPKADCETDASICSE